MFRSVLFGVMAIFAFVSTATATDWMVPSFPELIGKSDAVVEGEVIAIEPDLLELDLGPLGRYKKGDRKFQVAIFRPSERLFGVPEGETIRETIRVAFVPQDQQPTDGLSATSPVLKVGQKYLLYLQRDKEKNLLAANRMFSMGVGGEPVALGKLTRRICKLLEHHEESLHSKDPEDRMLTAWTLAARYQNMGSDEPHEECSAEESHTIIDGLLEIPDSNPFEVDYSGDSAARELCLLISKLGQTAEDGWNIQLWLGGGPNIAGVRTWLREHRETFRIRRPVAQRLPAPPQTTDE